MAVIATGYTLFVTSQFDLIFRLATNVLAKFVDTTCVFRDAGAAVGQGGAVKEMRAIGTYKKQENRYQLCLFLFINNVDLKNNNKIMENHSEFSGCPKSCNKVISSRSR